MTVSVLPVPYHQKLAHTNTRVRGEELTHNLQLHARTYRWSKNDVRRSHGLAVGDDVCDSRQLLIIAQLIVRLQHRLQHSITVRVAAHSRRAFAAFATGAAACTACAARICSAARTRCSSTFWTNHTRREKRLRKQKPDHSEAKRSTTGHAQHSRATHSRTSELYRENRGSALICSSARYIRRNG
jgi:hypothetical protein